MSAILAALKNHPVMLFTVGQNVLSEGETTGRLYLLISGSVEVWTRKKGVKPRPHDLVR